jgi:uncharacterized RmlC-like cupin family protein
MLSDTTVKIYPIEPLYKKPNGLYVQEIDRDDLPLGFASKVRHLVTIPAGQCSANHKHPRSEGFIGIGSALKFYWLDNNGTRHCEVMTKDDGLLLFVVPPFVAHAIVNESDAPAVLLEYANMPQSEKDIEIVQVI